MGASVDADPPGSWLDGRRLEPEALAYAIEVVARRVAVAHLVVRVVEENEPAAERAWLRAQAGYGAERRTNVSSPHLAKPISMRLAVVW